jgi:hypothetical protein
MPPRSNPTRPRVRPASRHQGGSDRILSCNACPEIAPVPILGAAIETLLETQAKRSTATLGAALPCDGIYPPPKTEATQFNPYEQAPEGPFFSDSCRRALVCTLRQEAPIGSEGVPSQ